MSDLDKLIQDNIRANTEVTVSTSGTVFGDLQGQQTQEALGESFVDALGRGFNSINAGVGMYKELKRQHAFEPNPSFRISDHWDTISKDVPMEYWDSFKGVDSLDEAMDLKRQFLEEQEDLRVLGLQGASGMTAMMAAGMFDVDAPLMLASGGAAMAAKSGRLVNALRAGSAAAATNMGVEAVNAAVRPTVNGEDVAVAGIAGLALGGAAGSLLKKEAMLEAGGGASVGAMQNPFKAVASTLRVNELEETADISKATKNFVRQNALDAKLETGDSFADNFEKMLSKVPYLRTDYDRAMTSNSDTLKWLGYELLESATGKVRNNMSSSMLKDTYQKRILSAGIPDFQRAFDDYAQAKGMNFATRHLDHKELEEFGKAVHFELYNRRYGAPEDPNLDPAVKNAADAVERMGNEGYGIARGKEGEAAIRGFEEIKPTRGWSPLHWKGDKIKEAFKIHGKDKVQKAIAYGYQKSFDIDEKTALQMSRALTTRALAREEGFDTSVSNLLTADGREFLRQSLRNNSVDDDTIAGIMKIIEGNKKEQGKSSFAKSRNEIDLRIEVDGVRLIDLVDNDMQRVWTRYARGVSGQGALARKGITSYNEKSKLINAILEEDPEVDRQWLEDMFTHFDAAPIAGGVSPMVRRAIQLTNLALLNGLGLTQAAELAAQVSSIGFKSFVETAPEVLRSVYKEGKLPKTLQDLEALTGRVGDEHLLIRDDYAIDMSRGDTPDRYEATKFVDAALAKGQRVQGYMSAFYKMRQFQQRLAVVGMANKVAKAMRDNTDLSKRMYDIWGDDATSISKEFKKLIDDGTITFTDKGVLDELNMSKWDPDLAERFAVGLNRHTDMTVQKTLAGEDSIWMHKDIGKVMTHLRTFPLLAMRKQFIRHARIMDDETAMLFMYGMGSAGLVYATREAVAGRSDRLDAGSLAKGAFGLSNATGWLPMWTDPVAAMLGMDSLKFNQYGPRGGYAAASSGVIPTPPIIPTLNRLGRLPGAVADLADGEVDRQSVYSYTALPLIGNLYGFSYMFNQLK